MRTTAACRFLIGSHESADASFGIGPQPAPGAQLAHELPVVGGFPAEVAFGYLVGFEEGINLADNWMRHTPFIPISIQHRK